MLLVKTLGGYYTPYLKEYEPAFRHCMGGMFAADEAFIRENESVFKLHGITLEWDK